MKQFVSEVIRNGEIAKNYYELTFRWPDKLDPPFPGQFLELRCTENTSPLLRRPFAFSGFDPIDMAASFIYEVRGPGTQIIAAKQTGNFLDIIAPLGNHFTSGATHVAQAKAGDGHDLKNEKKAIHVLISGGIGLGPILFFARFLKEAKLQYKFIHGAREASFLPNMKSIAGLDPVFCTDDGSAGFHGKTTDYLESIMSKLSLPASIYACGPLPMLKCCHNLSEVNNLECFVSMEQIMGCGFGACMGCVIRIVSPPGFARVCEEGPIFPSREIVWT